MRPSLNLDLPDPEWLTLMKAERDRGRSVSEIARLCGMARPSVSMLLAGTYPARSLDLVERKHGAAIVLALRDGVFCPHLRKVLSAEECLAHATAPISISNVARMRQSEACRRCPQNPETNRKGDAA